MSRIVIIGNGFDRAHGLATDYGSFVKRYLTNVLSEFEKKHYYDDKLLKISHGYSSNRYPTFWTEGVDVFSVIDKMKTLAQKKDGFVIDFKSVFFASIYSQVKYNWVDIEDTFFKMLIDPGVNIKELNEEFECLRKELIKYLYGVQENKGELIVEKYLDQFAQIDDDIIFVSFNYTDTVEPYRAHCLNTKRPSGSKRTVQIIYIHGNLDESQGIPIFGIGDEYHDDYVRLRDSDNYIDFLEHSKSQWYLRNGNYSKLVTALRGGLNRNFVVDVYGHSCGRSDKTLLKYIFQHDNCSAINLYYYEGEKDYINKTKELSRLFDDPLVFRDRVKPFNSYNMMPQLEIKENKLIIILN